MNQELLQAVQFLKTEKGLPADVIFESLEAVLLSAYKRETGTHAEATATIDRETGVYHIFVTKTVVEDVEDPELEISLTDAQALNSAYAVGDLVQQEVTPKNFGRMAAQTAKQVMTQRLKEAERNVI